MMVALVYNTGSLFLTVFFSPPYTSVLSFVPCVRSIHTLATHTTQNTSTKTPFQRVVCSSSFSLASVATAHFVPSSSSSSSFSILFYFSFSLFLDVSHWTHIIHWLPKMYFSHTMRQYIKKDLFLDWMLTRELRFGVQYASSQRHTAKIVREILAAIPISFWWASSRSIERLES